MIEAKFPPFTYTHPEYAEPPEKVLTVCCGESTPLDGDWKEWDGSADLPPDLSPEDEVDVLFRGTPMEERPSIKGYCGSGRTWCWRHVLGAGDIVAYRKVEEEAPTKEYSISAPEGEGWVKRDSLWLAEGRLPPKCPSYSDMVEVQHRDSTVEVVTGREFSWLSPKSEDKDIIRYRVVKKEEPSQQQQQPTTSQYQVGGDHYTNMTIQPWDAAKAWYGPVEYLGYHLITANAYLARHKSKGGLQDIKKARHHLDELIRYFEEDEDYPY